MNIIVFTGAGISAESGIRTFRDSGGLWEEHRIEDVASPEGWERNMEMVLNFYNLRRKQVLAAKPNAAHLAIASLQTRFNVQVITQNIDDLHERAGSKKVVHLHGEILKSRSTLNPHLVYDIKGDSIHVGDKCELGSQLRPHIVWFGEMVPMLETAIFLTQKADIFIVIGSSLQVYPAASLIQFAPEESAKFLIDPNAETHDAISNLKIIREKATKAVPALVDQLLKNKF